VRLRGFWESAGAVEGEFWEARIVLWNVFGGINGSRE
jgi:hypothetical protein